MRTFLLTIFTGVFLGIMLSSCEKPLQPIGYSNGNALVVEANGWQSIDTVISVDPQTFVMDTTIVATDLRPDTARNGDVVFSVSEYAPIFAGCETDEDPALCTQRKLREFVNSNLEYPRWAKVRGIQGTSIATFIIGADGRVRDTGVERSMGDEIDKLVLQLVEQIPIWYPAFHNGEPVAMKYRLPVTFTLPIED
ncbi:MAG: energy transducer TonB [Saprospiraceae bacterium]